MPGSTASYAFPILLFIQCFSLLVTVLLWMSSKCFLKPERMQEDSPDGKLSTGVLQWYLHFRTGKSKITPPGVRGTVAKTGQLTLQMKNKKQRKQPQNISRQRSYSSEDSGSFSSLPRNGMDMKNGQSASEMRTQTYDEGKARKETKKNGQQSSSMESPVRMNIGTVQFNTIKYSDSKTNSRKSGMLKKYPTRNDVNETTQSESSDSEDEFIETFEEIENRTATLNDISNNKNEKQLPHEDQHQAARYALGSVQPIYKHHHFNRQMERGYLK